MTLVQPGPEMQIDIRKSLNEDVNTRDSDLEHIKEWLRKQPHLPSSLDDQRLMTFLRGCNFSLEKCKYKLDMYYTMRAACPELFSNRDITRPEMQRVAKLALMPPLPGLTPDGKRVIVMTTPVKECDTNDIFEAMKMAMMIGDIRLEAEKTGVAGDVYILDASAATVSHFTKFTPSMVKKFLVCVQEAYPVKVKEVHVINVNPLVDTIVTWIKPLLKEKIRNRIHIHPNLETLFKFVPKEMLPEEFGGTAGKVEDFQAAWVKKLEEYGPWFKAQEDQIADESKRPGKPTNYDDLFGLDGSFKQLQID